MRKLIVFLLVLGALLVVADRVAAYEADQVLSQRLASAYQFGQQPQVQVQGIPFLTQWSSGRYQEIDVHVPSMTAHRVSVNDLTAQLRTVTTAAFATSSADVSGATVGQVNLQGVVPYDSLPVPSGFQLAPQGNQLKVSGTATSQGISVPITAIVNVGVQNGALRLTTAQVDVPVSVSRLGLGPQVTAQVNQQLAATASALQLPMGVHLDAVAVTDGGLQVAASASQVQVPQA
jgi:DUF2993 family protein